ncbi:MAG: DMT family transporter [Firmicutes bacterium]|nr:DMT family transporter [Bacillota bacterium]
MKPYLAAFISSCLFGLSFTFSRSALQHVDPMQMLSFRFLLAAALMHALRAVGVIKLDLRSKDIRPLLMLGVIQPVLYFIFETVGISLTSASEASIVGALIPVFTVLFAVIFLKERPTWVQLCFAAVSVAGVLLIAAVEALGEASGNLAGLIILLGAPICAACFLSLHPSLSPQCGPPCSTSEPFPRSVLSFWSTMSSLSWRHTA